VIDSDEFTATAPKGPSIRDAQRKGAILVVGTGSDLESLRRGRLLIVGEEPVDVGRRPAPAGGRRALTLRDRTVSSVHARITYANGAHFIEDAGSTNGTMVDGRAIGANPVQLHEGTVLFLGSHVLVFRTLTISDVSAIEADLASPFTPVPTLSPILATTCAKLRKLAPSSSELLLLGETGVGKDVFANAIHAASGRKGPMVAINCAALPRELVESELFGYERGAHSTAKGRKEGLIETAEGGTLFLDELGEMPLETQSKLLRFLQDRTYLPVGATKLKRADVRILAASSRVTPGGGTIQEALLGRLGAEPIRLPPLRERLEDIGQLVAYFVSKAPKPRTFADDAFQSLFLHGWPLNVRELTKVINEAELLSRDVDVIGCEHLPASLVDALEPREDAPPPATDTVLPPAASPARPGVRERRAVPSADELRELMVRYRGNVAHVAKHLNRQWAVISRTLRRYGIDPATYRTGPAGDDGEPGDGTPNDDGP
jgi:DNA-binding NtrC family response regulator